MAKQIREKYCESPLDRFDEDQNDAFVTKSEDDFCYEKPRWCAELSNGETIYQDDYRPGVEPAMAWYRLALYVRQRKLRIKKLYLQFRSHFEFPLPETPQAFFFCHAIGAFLEQSGISYGFFVVGYIQDGVLRTQRWQVPELILVEEQDRDIIEGDPCIIWNR